MLYDISPYLTLTSLSITFSRSIYVAANGIISFFLMAELDSIVYTYLIFIHSSVDGHLGCFQIVAIINSAAVNTGVYVSFLLRLILKLESNCCLVDKSCLILLRRHGL